MKLANCQTGAAFGLDLLVTDVSTGKTKKGSPYLSLMLSDGVDRISARWWDCDNADGAVQKGSIYYVTGNINEYQGERQAIVASMAPSDAAPEDFMPRSATTPELLFGRIDHYIRTIASEPLREAVATLVQGLWHDRFYAAPAASSNHHARVGGLAEHTLSMLDEWAALAPVLDRWHPDLLDHDVMVAGIVLHDLGKAVEIESTPGFPYSTHGQMLGHIPMAAIAVRGALGDYANTERGLRVLNCILSHHGKLEWGSPVVPRCPEAVLLHEIDMLDSRMEHFAQLVANGVGQDGWTERDKLFDGAMRGPMQRED
jgi:3'-5' exoribonuclease